MPYKDLQARQDYLKQYRLDNPRIPAQQRKSHLKRTYGLTEVEFNALLESQGGRCANCGATSPGGNLTHFRVDHCHETGAIRGLLCQRCNIGLGYLGDNITGLQSALNYLSKSEPTLFPGIWKRIAPKISSSISAPSGQETLSGCSDNKSSSEMGSASTAVQITI